MDTQWIEIFKAGRHTDSQGRIRDWSIGDLDHMAASYDPSQREAPVVIGHPKDNAPAYGWVRRLKRDGETLYAEVDRLQPAFVTMVRDGRFKKRSISVYPDGTLRHVGFLGAMPPAVSGLKDVDFSGSDEAVVEIEFSENVVRSEHMDEDHKSKDPRNHAGGEPENPAPPAAESSEDKKKIQELVALVARQDAKLKELEERLAKAEAEKTAKAEEEFCQGLVAEGRLLPSQVPHAVAVLGALSAAAPVEFADAEGKVVKDAPGMVFREFLAAAPVQVHYGEYADGQRAARGTAETHDFAARVTEHVDKEKAAGRSCSYAEALQAVRKRGA